MNKMNKNFKTLSLFLSSSEKKRCRNIWIFLSSFMLFSFITSLPFFFFFVIGWARCARSCLNIRICIEKKRDRGDKGATGDHKSLDKRLCVPPPHAGGFFFATVGRSVFFFLFYFIRSTGFFGPTNGHRKGQSAAREFTLFSP